MYRLEGVLKLTRVTKNIYKETDLTLSEIHRVLKTLRQLNLSIQSFQKKEEYYTLKEKLTYKELKVFFNKNSRKCFDWIYEDWTVDELKKICRKYGYTVVRSYNKLELVDLVYRNQKIYWNEIVPRMVEKRVAFIRKKNTCPVLSGSRRQRDVLIISATHSESCSPTYWTLRTNTTSHSGYKLITDFEIDGDISRNKFVSHIRKYLSNKKRYLLTLFPGITLLHLLKTGEHVAKIEDLTKVAFNTDTFKEIEKEFKLKRKGRTKLEFLMHCFKRTVKKNYLKKLKGKKIIISTSPIAIGTPVNKREFIYIAAHLQIEFIRKDFYLCTVEKHTDTNLVQALYQIYGEINHYIHLV